MKIDYYFDDSRFEFELDENEITEFLVFQWLKESNTSLTAETRRVLEYIIKSHSLWDDSEILESYRDEIEEYFEDNARDCWEDSKDYEEDKLDWFGTKLNVIGL